MRLVRGLLRAGFTLAVWTVALWLSARFHAHTDLARRALADVINEGVSDAIAGRLEVSDIESFDGRRLVVQNAVLRDTADRPVIMAGRITLAVASWSPGQLLQIAGASVQGAELRLYDDGSGLPTFLNALDAPDADTSDENEGKPHTAVGLWLRSQAPPSAIIDRIQLSHVRISGELLGLSGIQAHVDRGQLTIEVGEHVDVRLASIAGTLSQPFGFKGHIEHLRGLISDDPAHGVQLRVDARRSDGGDDERVDARIGYRTVPAPAPKQAKQAKQANQTELDELDIRLRAQPIMPDTLVRVGFPWAEPIEGPLTGRFRLHGPLDALAIHADVRGPGGQVTVDGEILADSTRVELTTEGLALGRAVRDAPTVTVSGRGQITVPVSGDPKVAADIGPLRYWGIALPGFELRGALLDDRLVIDRLSARQRGAQLRASGWLGFDGPARLDVRARFDDVGSDPRLRGLVPNLQGALDARLQLTVRGHKRPQITLAGEVEMRRLRYHHVSAGRIVLQGTARGDLERPALNVTLEGQAVRAAGYDLGAARFSVQGGPLNYTANGSFARGQQRTFGLSAHVAAGAAGLTIDADPIEFRLGGAEHGSWRGALRDLSIDDRGRISVGMLRLANRAQRLEVSGRLHGDDRDRLLAQLQSFDLRAVHALIGDAFPLRQGYADAMLELSGDMAQPAVLLQGALREATLIGVPQVSALYFVSYGQDHLELDGELDFGGRGRLTARGSARVPTLSWDTPEALEAGEYALTVGLERLSWDLLSAAGRSSRTRGPRRATTLSAELQVRGSPMEPDITGTFVLSDQSLFPGHPLSVAGSASYIGGETRIDAGLRDHFGDLAKAQARVVMPWSSLMGDELSPRALLSHAWSLQGELVARPTARLPPGLARHFPIPLELGGTFDIARHQQRAQGQVDLQATPTQVIGDAVCGQVQRPELSATFRLVDGSTTTAVASALLNGRELLTLNSSMETPVEAWLAGDAFKPTRLKIEVQANVPDFQHLPYLCRAGGGDLSAKLLLLNGLTTFPSVSTKVRARYLPREKHHTRRRQVRIRSCEDDPALISLEARANKQRAQVDGQMAGCGGRHADLTVNVPVSWTGVLPTIEQNESMLGSFVFAGAQLRPLLDRIPGVLTGEAIANGRVSLTGTPAEIRYSGGINLSDGRLHIIATGQRVHDVQASLAFRGTTAHLTHLSARAGQEGKLAMKGRWLFDNWVPDKAQFVLSLADFPVRREGSKIAWLTGSGAIAADIEPDHSHTELTIHELDVRLPSKSRTGLQSLDPNPEVEIVDASGPTRPDDPYRLEFDLDGTRGISVRRRDFQTQVASELALSYVDPDLKLGGYVAFERGQFEAFGKDFEILQGGMRFSGGTDFDPRVNLTASHRAEGGRTVNVVVSGRLSNPKVAFTSDSCPGESGAIALLLTGRCVDDGRGGRTSQGAEQEFASGLLAGLFTLGARRELGGLIPNLAFESRGQGYATRVRAGVETDAFVPKFMRSVVKKVYVQGAVSTSDGDSSVRDARDRGLLDFLIEVYFPHDIIGTGRFAPDTDTWGLDLMWEP